MSSLPTVFVLELDGSEELDESLFSEEELASVFFYKRKEDQLLKAGSLLLSSRYLGKSIFHTGLGKPFVKDGPYFSLSHSYPFAVLAVSSFPVGVDVEKVKEWDPRMDALCFSQMERQERLDHLRLWTLKEASYKVRGDHEFDPPKDEVKITGSTTLTFGKENYYYQFIDNGDKILTIAGTELLDGLRIEALSFHSLMEKRRNSHEGT